MWLLTVPITAVEGAAAEAFTINLTVNVDTASGFIQRTSAGWYCGPIEDGDSNGDPYFFQAVTCQYTYAPGQPITPFTLVIESFGPAGNVSISGDGNADPNTSNDQQTF